MTNAREKAEKLASLIEANKLLLSAPSLVASLEQALLSAYKEGRKAGIEECVEILKAQKEYLADSPCTPFQFKGLSCFDAAIKQFRALLEEG